MSRRRRSSTEAKQSKIQVLKSVAGSEEDFDEVLEVHQFVTDPARVRISVGVTKSLGDYEFLRVDVSVEIPCYVEEIDAAYEYAARTASERLEEEVVSYMSDDGELT